MPFLWVRSAVGPDLTWEEKTLIVLFTHKDSLLAATVLVMVSKI